MRKSEKASYMVHPVFVITGYYCLSGLVLCISQSYTALLTMPFTFAGSISWKLSWFYTRLFAGYLAV